MWKSILHGISEGSICWTDFQVGSLENPSKKLNPIQDLSDRFGAKKLTSHPKSFHIVCSRMSPLNWTISMVLFSLLYGERPKLNQHWVWERKHHAQEGLDCEVKQAKTRFIDQKQFRQFPKKVIQNPRTTSDFFYFYYYTAIGNDDQTDQILSVSLRYSKSNKFFGLSY